VTEVNGFNLEKLVGQFQIVAEFVEGHAWTKGHINDTFIITCRHVLLIERKVITVRPRQAAARGAVVNCIDIAIQDASFSS